MRESRPSALTRPNVARLAASVALVAAFGGAVTSVAQAEDSGGPVQVMLSTPTPSPTSVPPTPVPTPVVPRAPYVKSLSPNHGPAAGGNEIVISSSAYAQTHTVTVGGQPAEIVARTSVDEGEAGVQETSVTIKVPAGTAGTTVDVSLDNTLYPGAPFGGVSAPSERSAYTYDAEPGQPATVDLAYGLVGTAAFKTLVSGSVPVNGSVDATLNTATGAFTGNLAINPGTAKLLALGIFPVAAKIAIEQTEKVAGTLDGTALAATAKVRIKLPSVTVFGIQLVGGANCQAKQISSVPLANTGPFTPETGGRIAGSFAISNLTGCGGLTNIVSPLTSGSGNVIVLYLTPKA